PTGPIVSPRLIVSLTPSTAGTQPVVRRRIPLVTGNQTRRPSTSRCARSAAPSATTAKWPSEMESFTVGDGYPDRLCTEIAGVKRPSSGGRRRRGGHHQQRSEEHTSELQSPDHLVCRL